MLSEPERHQLPVRIRVHPCPFVVKINPEPQPKHKKSLGPRITRMNTNILSGSKPLPIRLPNYEENSRFQAFQFSSAPEPFIARPDSLLASGSPFAKKAD
jgi:hypothetical protein